MDGTAAYYGMVYSRSTLGLTTVHSLGIPFVTLWMQRWRLSTWLHVSSLSQQILRQVRY